MEITALDVSSDAAVKAALTAVFAAPKFVAFPHVAHVDAKATLAPSRAARQIAWYTLTARPIHNIPINSITRIGSTMANSKSSVPRASNAKRRSKGACAPVDISFWRHLCLNLPSSSLLQEQFNFQSRFLAP